MTDSVDLTLPPADSPHVSIVIVNWNTCDLLRDCIRSILAETRSPHEIIVIDNASADGSAAMVAAEFPEVSLIANADNRGFAAANNQGLRIAKGRNLLLLNPDTVILDGAVDRMLAWLVAHPDVGCVGCQVLEGPGLIQRTSFADPTPLNLLIEEMGLTRLASRLPFFGRPNYASWDRTSERDVDVVSGMFLLVPRQVVEAVGLLDEAFFVYAEEADWCRRIRKAGWRCVFSPVAQIIHLDGGTKSTGQIRSRMYVQLQKSLVIYSGKHFGLGGKIAARATYIGAAALRWTVFGLLRLVKSNDDIRARLRLSRASLLFHLTGREPAS